MMIQQHKYEIFLLPILSRKGVNFRECLEELKKMEILYIIKKLFYVRF